MTEVRLVPWSDGDLALLRRINTPDMRRHVGGPETEEQVLARHGRYLALDNGRMFRVEVGSEAAGSVAYWSRVWHDEPVYETGWNVLPEFQGRGASIVVSAATRSRSPSRVMPRSGNRPMST
ncbi:GNAT family N-acetyltransferase, partial [Asanoa sp. NPDC050611]|uniref:GNAT family N-acetyltransferase n=1 Tax=Asanoa sp. NPDC050611 TaxID=3157098 RepID=UPI0034011543